MKNPINLILLCFSFLLLVQCQSDGTKADPNADRTLPSKVVNPSESKAQYDANPNSATGSKYVTDVIKTALKSETSLGEKKSLLNSGLEVAASLNETSMKASLLNTYLKTVGPKEDPSKALSLATLLKSINKTSAANILFYGYSKLGVEADEAKKALGMLDAPLDNVETYISDLRKKISENPTRFSLNEVNAREYVDACEAYAMVMPDSEETPTHLFNAAEVAKSLKSFNKSFALFDWLIEKYPNHKKTPTALFLKGFILENELNNDNGAKVFYEEFLEKYPSHDLADDVEFLISNLGKSNEEILKMIESKQQ